jgi:hypothetical protein
LTPKVLRNDDNAEQTIQIRLELSLAEGRQLQHWLTHLLPTEPRCTDDSQTLQGLLANLSRACDQAVRFIQCPVCRTCFPQGTVGRSAQYCTSACKQKAYRQRKNARKKQFGPPAWR